MSVAVRDGAAADSSAAPRAPLCRTLEELYAPAARRNMAVLLEAWLTRQNATPFQLLHSPDLARRLENSGADLQQALQKVAVPAALDRGASVHEVMRGLHKLFDQGMARLSRLRGVAAPVAVRPETLAQACLDALAAPDPAFALGCAVAAALVQAETWSEKLDLLLDLGAVTLADPAAAALAATVTEQPLQELLDAPAAQAELFGPDIELGEMILRRLALAETATFAAVAQAQPALMRAAGQAAPPLERLGKALAAGRFPGVRRGLNRRVLADFTAKGRLKPKDPLAEIELLRLLAVLLTAAAGPAMPEDDVRAAIVERSQMLVERPFLAALLGPSPDPFGELSALARVLENVAGPGNRTRAVKLLEQAIATRRVHQLLAEAPQPATYGDALVRLRHRIVRAAGGVPGADRVLDELGKLDALAR